MALFCLLLRNRFFSIHLLLCQSPTFLSMTLPSLLGLSSMLNTRLTSFGMMKLGSLFWIWSLSSTCSMPIFSFILWFSGTCSSYDPADKKTTHCNVLYNSNNVYLIFKLTLCFLLRMKEALLSLVSMMLMETEVVAVLPEAIPLMSWAFTTTTYWLLVSRSRVFILQLITPAERQWQRQAERKGVIFEVTADSYPTELKTARLCTPH